LFDSKVNRHDAQSLDGSFREFEGGANRLAASQLCCIGLGKIDISRQR
jgi:hypothetical protein